MIDNVEIILSRNPKSNKKYNVNHKSSFVIGRIYFLYYKTNSYNMCFFNSRKQIFRFLWKTLAPSIENYLKSLIAINQFIFLDNKGFHRWINYLKI